MVFGMSKAVLGMHAELLILAAKFLLFVDKHGYCWRKRPT
jgi:hypothetical protein